ncbi:hypothetical protein, partial [Neisseria gonorrhoeae]
LIGDQRRFGHHYLLQLLGKFVHILYFFCFRFFIYWETGTLKCQFMHCVNRSIHPDSLSG